MTEELITQSEELEHNLKQLALASERRKAVIVHPHLGASKEDAVKLAADWGSREEKQLMDNIAKAFR